MLETRSLRSPTFRLEAVATRERSSVPFALIVGAFAAISLWLAAHLNLYIDELYSLHTTGGGFPYALQQSLGFEQQPPLFFLALTAWRTIDASDFFARLFSIGCCIATLFVTLHFGRRHLTTLPDWTAPLAFALNPIFLWVALQIRVYAAVVLLGALLLSLFFEAFCGERPSLLKTTGFTFVAIAALYTQYFLGSMLLGFALVLAGRSRWGRIVPFGLSMIVTALAILPLLLGSVSHEIRDVSVVHALPPLLLAGHTLSFALSFAFPHAWVVSGSEASHVAYAAIVVCLVGLLFRESRIQGTASILAIVVATMVAFFLLVVLAAGVPLEFPRHITALVAPVVLLVLALLATIPSATNRGRITAAYLASVSLLGAGYDAELLRSPLSKTGDWQRVGDVLNANVAASEPIVVFDSEGALGVRHYYRGKARIVPIPQEQSFAVFDRRDFAIHTTPELDRVFPRPSKVTGRAWFVFGVTACSMVETSSSCALFDTYVADRFRVLQKCRFNGTNVLEIEAKARPPRLPLEQPRAALVSGASCAAADSGTGAT